MKSGYYVFVENCGSIGVIRKMEMQMDELNKHCKIEPLQISTVQHSMLRRIINLLPWNSFSRDYGSALSSIVDPDFLYVRHTFIDKEYIDFWKKVRREYPQCKIIVELPNYPYNKQMRSSLYTAIVYVKELLYRKNYKDIVDRFVTFSNDSSIMSVPTITTKNGLRVDKVYISDERNEYSTKEINLLAVAALLKQHGYERIIRGLHIYYNNGGTRIINFHIVGDGREKKYYEKLVKKYSLERYVSFHGYKFGDELEQYYSKADAGIAVFGAYKIGMDNISAIKDGEYLAKGLPIISGCRNRLFDEIDSDIVLMYENENSAVDVSKIVRFLDKLHNEYSCSELRERIRDNAVRFADNAVTMKPIVDYINS